MVGRPPEQETGVSYTLGWDFLLEADVTVFLHIPETSWKDNPPTGGRPARRVLAQTCFAILHCRMGHRGLKSTTEKLADSEPPQVEDCGI